MQADRSRPLALADQPPLTLGALRVEPATRQLHHRGVATTLEPRVMQVLVVLAREPGRVVGRQELIDRCWDGRVVGDNAINRVISRLRHLAAGLDDDAFAIESIARVGYRLTPPPGTPATAAAATGNTFAAATADSVGAATPPVTAVGSAATRGAGAAGRPAETATPASLRRRRWLVGAGVGTALAGSGALGIAMRIAERPAATPLDAQSVELRRLGELALRQGTYLAAAEAVDHFRVLCDKHGDRPEHWGLLALACAARRGFNVQQDVDPLGELTRTAAARALAADPHNADAAVALVMLRPLFRGWHGMETACTALLQQHPRHWMLLSTLARVHAETGRWRTAIPLLERALEAEPLLPSVSARRAFALWCVGRGDDAAVAFDDALERWRRHPLLWHRVLQFRLFSGRLDEAAAQLADERQRSYDENGMPREIARLAVQALAQPACAPLAEELAGAIARARTGGSMASQWALALLAAVGRIDQAFEMARVYYFGGAVGARLQPAPARLEMRATDLLFTPDTRVLRMDARFAELTAELGLDDYWRVAGADPDHRRAAAG